ncbi:MAG: hypothetical protein AB7K71_21520 [Polyangiaceae bacterium]
MATSRPDRSLSAEGRGTRARAVGFAMLLIWGVTLLCLAALDLAGYQAFVRSLEWWTTTQ